MNINTSNQLNFVGQVFFDAVLHPHRSLTPTNFRILMTGVAIAMLTIGLLFTFMGAWPVIGFCGVEFVLIYCMFQLNYRAAKSYERIRLSNRSFDVDKINTNGVVSRWQFEPTWLQVNMDNPPEHHSQLTVASHGRRLTIGAFLTPQERLEVAEAIRNALNVQRTMR